MKFKFFILHSTFLILMTSCGESCDRTTEPEKPVDELKDSSAYITKVFEYQYAPGQYASNTILTTAQNFEGKPSYLYTVGPASPKSALSLGGWGGYVVGGFNHNVANVDGNDFMVCCGSSPGPEPAVVYVMQDLNGNGLPDDTWYELKGSEYAHPDTYRDYQVIYYKPATPTGNVYWKDNKGNADTLRANYTTTNSSSWWPNLSKDSLVFNGTRLPLAYHNLSMTPVENWLPVAGLFASGYAENSIGNDYDIPLKGNLSNISYAIDANGNPVSLPHIRFIKVQTGVFQQAGWLNEISTEVYGAADLQLLK